MREERLLGIGDYLNRYYAPATVLEYSRDIADYVSSCPMAAEAMYGDVMSYVVGLRNRYGNATTLRGKVCAVKAYYAYLCHAGIRADNPARAIRLKDKVSKDIQLQDLFTVAELEAMLLRDEPYRKFIYRNRVLMSLLIYQGLRPEEVCGIRLEDIDLTLATVYIRKTLKSVGRTLELKASQVLLFYEYIHQVRPGLLREGYSTDILLIGQQGRALPPWAISVHIKRCYGGVYPGRVVSAGRIRQSVLMNLLKAGHDISVVQLFAGHVCASSTQRYEQNRLDSLKMAIDEYHPYKRGET